MIQEIHLLTKCMNNCIFCAVKRDGENIRSLKAILKDLKLTNSSATLILSGGEPLLHKDILKIIKIAKERSKNIILETSGNKFFKKIIDNLISLGIIFKVSIHGYNPVLNDSISQNKGSFFKTIRLLKYLQKNNANFYTNTVITKKNYTSLEKLIQFIRFNFPNTKNIQISYVRYYPFSKSKKNVASLNHIKRYLLSLKKYEHVISLENVPLCICDLKSNRNYNWDMELINNGEKIINSSDTRIYLQLCKKCSKKNLCQGLHKYYEIYFKFNPKPFLERQLLFFLYGI